MRTTLELDERLLERATESAHERGITLSTFVAQALERELGGERLTGALRITPWPGSSSVDRADALAAALRDARGARRAAFDAGASR